jgi:hypothetical protein
VEQQLAPELAGQLAQLVLALELPLAASDQQLVFEFGYPLIKFTPLQFKELIT